MKNKKSGAPIWKIFGGSKGETLLCETSFTRTEVKKLFPGARIVGACVYLVVLAAAGAAQAQEIDAIDPEMRQAMAQERIAGATESLAGEVATLAQDQAFWSNQLEVTRSYGRAYVPQMRQTDF